MNSPRIALVTGLLLTAALVPTSASIGAERSLDGVLEQADRWDTSQAPHIGVAVDSDVTRDTPQALRMTWPKDLGDIAGTGVPNSPQVPTVWFELPEDLDLTQYTRLRFWGKIDGTRHGHLHVVFSNQALIWGEGVENHINNTPLDAGDWREHQVILGHVDPAERETYRWLGIASINVGRQPDEAPEMQVWLDDFTLTDEPLRKARGWDADPTVVICSQLGFRRFHEKLAVVNGATDADTFTVNLGKTGREAFRGDLAIVESPIGRYKVADFTPLTTPGRYEVRVGDLKSPTFAIGDDAYSPGIELLSDWVFNMRCGCKTDLHEACHLDDGTLVDYEGDPEDRNERSRRHVDVVGGWHDAGDVRTYYRYTYEVAYQALRARASGWRRDRDGDGRDDLFDSAAWAMQHLAKIQHPDTGELYPKIEDWPDYRRGNYWSDCLVGTPDDRHIMVRPEDVDGVGQACASAGLFARGFGDTLPEVADAAMAVAEDRWAAWFDPETGRKQWREEPIHVHRHGYHIAKWGQGSLQLHLATGNSAYLEFARLCADTIMGYQRKAFYPGGDEPMGGEIFSWLRTLPDRDLPEEYLADLMLELPDDDDYYRWRATLARSAEWWMKPTRRNWEPFTVPHLEVPAGEFGEDHVGVPLERSADDEVTRYLVPTAGTLQLPDTAFALHRIAQALGDAELERLARAQVQWAVGHNPFGISWVCDLGEDSINQFYSFSQGRMPGCVAGFGIGHNGVPGCGRPYGAEPVTICGLRLMRAMIAISQPARMELAISDGDGPWRGRVTVRWTETGERVFAARTDQLGRVPEFTLDGGQDYELVLGDVVIPISPISGTDHVREIDLQRIVTVDATGPASVTSGEGFAVSVVVRNAGLGPARIDFAAYAEDATSTETAKQLDLAPGKEQTIAWPFVAGEAGRPYVVFIEADGNRETCQAVTGAISE